MLRMYIRLSEYSFRFNVKAQFNVVLFTFYGPNQSINHLATEMVLIYDSNIQTYRKVNCHTEKT